MSSNPHHDWAVVVKNADKDFPGATIQTAYCNCTADLGGYCNYIAVFLFRVKSFIIQVKPHLPELVNFMSRMYHEVPKSILHYWQLRK